MSIVSLMVNKLIKFRRLTLEDYIKTLAQVKDNSTRTELINDADMLLGPLYYIGFARYSQSTRPKILRREV